VTGITDSPDNWPLRHLKDDELVWFDFDPSGLADFVRRFGAEYPDLPARLQTCRRAAWSCGSYLRLAESVPQGAVIETAAISNDDYSAEFQEYGIDLDRSGQPMGVELLHRPCMDG
jgi:hypothetical protein